MDAYFEANRQINEYECQDYLTNNCDCNNDDGKGDDFNSDYCEYDCFADAGMEKYCAERNPYKDDNQRQEEFDIEEYMECKQWQAQNGNNNNNNGNGKALYIGPYCAEQGGAIFLGIFKDYTCTAFADEDSGRTTYQQLTGNELPYSYVSIVGPDCVSCLNHDYNNNNANNNNNNANNNNMVSESCQTLYSQAGKCESTLPQGLLDYEPNTNACTYIEGIKIIRQDGIISYSGPRPSAMATAFIVIFAMSTASLAFYVYYLRMRLKAKQDRLLSNEMFPSASEML